MRRVCGQQSKLATFWGVQRWVRSLAEAKAQEMCIVLKAKCKKDNTYSTAFTYLYKQITRIHNSFSACNGLNAASFQDFKEAAAYYHTAVLLSFPQIMNLVGSWQCGADCTSKISSLDFAWCGDGSFSRVRKAERDERFGCCHSWCLPVP